VREVKEASQGKGSGLAKVKGEGVKGVYRVLRLSLEKEG